MTLFVVVAVEDFHAFKLESPVIFHAYYTRFYGLLYDNVSDTIVLIVIIYIFYKFSALYNNLRFFPNKK